MLRLDINLVFTIINLLMRYFLMRKFLFKPVNGIIAAREEIIMPFLGFSKLRGFIGTGFAQPKPKRIIAMVPIGSKCARGLRVSLPCLSAV